MEPNTVIKTENGVTTSNKNGEKSNKVCAVCGDKALGYNFNAVTCESCKAFFRRNALKDKEFKCPFNDNCEITVITRRFCQKCRLKKCVDIGMKKEYILSEDEKRQKKQKIEENRVRKRQYSTKGNSPLADESLPDSPQSGSMSPKHTSNMNHQSRRPQARILPSARSKSEEESDDLMNCGTDHHHHPQDDRPGPSTSKNLRLSSSNGSSSTFHQLLSEPDHHQHHHPPVSSVGEGNFDYQQHLDNSQHQHYQNNTRHSPFANHHHHHPHPGPFEDNSASSSTSNSMRPSSAASMTSATSAAAPRITTNCLGQEQFTVDQQQPFVTAGTAGAVASNASAPGGGSTSSGGGLNDWSVVDNLDEIVAVAIKAEFHTLDLVEMTNSMNDTTTEVKTSTGGGGHGGLNPNNSSSSTNTTTANNVQSTSVMGQQQPQLNERERERLDELYVASRALVEPMEHERDQYSNVEHILEPKSLISVMSLTDLAIKRIIRMTKKINSFTTMCQADQIALLKGGCTELMILRSVFNYDPDKNSWRLPSKDRPRELRLEVLKEASQLGVNLYEEHQRFVQSFEPQWRSDENVMLLLSAIALFTPERCNVVHKDVVKYEQDTYYYLLRRYLETVYSGCEPRRAYLSLIGKLQDLHRLNDSHIQVFLEVNPRQVEPLLIEIFDLNPRQ